MTAPDLAGAAGTGGTQPAIRRSIATVSLSGTLEDKLSAAARAGFDGVEIFENDLIACPLSPSDIRLLAADLGLEILLYQPFRDFETTLPDRLAASLRRAERKFAVMTALGAGTLLVCSSVSPGAADDDASTADQLRQLAERASAHGLRVAFEALAWGRHISSYARAWHVVSRADHPHLGLCLDSFHIMSLGHDCGPIRDIPGDKIFFLQLADAPLLRMDALPWSRHYRCFPGQGGFDLTGFMASVLAAGYLGPWSLEVFNDVFRQADADRTARDGMRSLLTLEDGLARPDPAGGAAGPALPVRLARLPAAASLRGYAFVELAVDGLLGQATERLLRSLGFSRRGRHRTKPVELWQQGAARVLVNRTGPAGGSRPPGDAAVAALAVESDDPDRSARRARALLAPAIPRRHEPGEADLTAVTAPDGSAVFFCRARTAPGPDWLEDFESRPGPEPAGPALITGVDHVALSQPDDGFDEATLFYQSLLGMRAQDSDEVASPYGLVRSRPMRAPDGGVRLVLNVPLRGGGRLPETTSSQHVAFGCADIFTAARAVRAAGTPMLPVPANYYEDLAARLDLDPHRTAELRAHGVLYDRDELGGEFFHFYTVMLGHRLFFEVVHRAGGYDGYGAPGTPVRMAAQLRHAAAADIGPD
ncbi:MAG: bifunctional sugar phosphate isomerase/epimerase/4-hydroxyphenylpyruvate dioxygenase family protein [Streptosporangiaceae bacterium]